MKFRTPKEIVDSNPVEHSEQICKDLFGEMGEQIAYEIRTDPKYKEHWNKFLEQEDVHRNRMVKLVENANIENEMKLPSKWWLMYRYYFIFSIIMSIIMGLLMYSLLPYEVRPRWTLIATMVGFVWLCLGIRFFADRMDAKARGELS